MGEEVTLWSVDLDDDVVGRELDRIPLGADEVLRELRFVHAVDARRFRRRRAFRRVILGGLVGMAAGEVEFAQGPLGKPVLSGAAGALHFSATHSAGRTWLAVGGAGPLGLDVERHARLLPELPGLIAQLAPAEQCTLERVVERDRVAAFLDVWTRKEAVLKAAGIGLRRDLNSFVVPVGALPRGEWVDLGPGTSRWWVQDLQFGPAFRGALASGAPCRVVQCEYPSDGSARPSATSSWRSGDG